jgi:hypothetical protein
MREIIKDTIDYFDEYPVRASFWVAIILALPIFVICIIDGGNIGGCIIYSFLSAVFVIYPIILCIINIISVFTTDKKWNLRIFEWLGIVWGGLYTIIYMSLGFYTTTDWWEAVYGKCL